MYLLGDKNSLSSKIGKKAYNLHLMRLASFNVPPGIVISYEELQFLHQPLFESELLKYVEEIGGFPVAVRSSGQMEDLNNASFAGLYQTFLEVQSIEELKESIVKCFASATHTRIIEYLKIKKNSNPEINLSEDFLKSQMSVLIQKMVDSKIAGVAFTVDPLTGKDEHLRIEAVNGLGEKLVSGQITPSAFVIDNKDGMLVNYYEGDEIVELNTEHILELADNIFRIQAYFKSPQDIEWSIDKNGKLWILQSRPITAIKWRTDLDEYTNADLKDGGVSSRVCTPVMYSLYNMAMSYGMDTYFSNLKLKKESRADDNWMIYKYGRVYWNAGLSKRLLFKIPDFNEKVFDENLGIEKDYGSKGPHKVPVNIKTIINALPIIFALSKEYKNSIKMLEDFKKNYPTTIKAYLNKLDSIKSISNDDFFKDFTDVILNLFFMTETGYFRIVYNNANFQSDFRDFILKVDKKTKGQTSIINLISGDTNITHINIQKSLLKLKEIVLQISKDKKGKDVVNIEEMRLLCNKDKRWQDEFKSFMNEHYHHGDAELEIMTPRWGEVPGRVEELVFELLKADKPMISTSDNFKKSLVDVEKRLKFSPITKMKFISSLKKSRYFLSNREKMREFSTMAYYIVRKYLLEMGVRLKSLQLIKSEHDVFFFYINELINFCKEKKFPHNFYIEKELVYRKTFYEGMTNIEAPNEFGPGISQRCEEQYEEKADDGKTIFKGIACSPGVYEGRANVILSIEDAKNIKDGDILITKFTDPGWTPILGLVSGVVTEVGGVLSHAAVIGREYGIPAILNVKGITKKIQTGTKIRIDGNKGIITIIE
ncbi:MAG: hypothetical protein HQK49_00115 [Oligoflexia bacterium]|nr:hypothetical protein [Oligoflexia bacterium]